MLSSNSESILSPILLQPKNKLLWFNEHGTWWLRWAWAEMCLWAYGFMVEAKSENIPWIVAGYRPRSGMGMDVWHYDINSTVEKNYFYNCEAPEIWKS